MSKTILKLQNGDQIHAIGLGTWKSKNRGEVGNAVRVALDNGYKHIDCAAIYTNQKEIGEVFNDVFNVKKTLKREDIWITSKLWNTDKKKEQVRPAFLKTLEDLQLKYLDLYLIHWPTCWVQRSEIPWPEDLDPSSDRLFPFLPNKKMETVNIPIEETWRELEKLVDEGLVRHIGISNFSVKQTEELLSIARIKPSVNQVEVHPYWPNKELREFSASKGIHISAYSPLGTPDSQPDSKRLMDDPTVNEIAKKYNKQPANVLIRWVIQNNMSVLPKSVTDSRIISNLVESDNFELKEEDLNTLNHIGFSLRYNDPSKWWGVKCFEDSPDV